MGGPVKSSESHSLRGPIDRPVLIRIRDVFEEQEPLATAQLDDFLDPSTVEVALDTGLRGAESARIDVQWTTQDDYKYHYTDSNGVDLRWGNHPHGGDYVQVDGTEHYHPPPDASSDPNEVEDSCIDQSPAELVTRAVCKLWRAAYDASSWTPLNAASNPP